MGTFASFYGNRKVPEDRIPELNRRMMRLLEQGGIMEQTEVSIYGKHLQLLRPISQNDKNRVIFNYNYFDDDGCEYAAYDTETGEVSSNKIAFGWCDFATVVMAMYTLLEFYTEEYSLAGLNGELTDGKRKIGWMNYLFDEKFTNHRLDDVWKIYSLMRNEYGDYKDDLLYLIRNGYTRGSISFLAVEYPERVREEGQKIIDYLVEKKQGENKRGEKTADKTVIAIRIELLNATFSLCEYLEKTDSPQLKKIASQIGSLEENSPETMRFNFGSLLELLRSSLERILETSGETKEETLERVAAVLKDHEGNLPAEDDAWNWVWFVSYLMPREATLKQLADVFELDFWELLERLGPDVEEQSGQWHSLSRGENNQKPVEKQSTEEFFKFSERGMSSDDRAYYWTEDGDVTFSDEMLQWLEDLGRELDELEEQAGELVPTQEFLKTLVETLHHIKETYRYIYCFEEAFYTLIENMHKRRTQAVLLQLRRLMERERGAFAEAEAEDTICLWGIAKSTYHPSRLKLKRYLAVLGNPRLRKQWLGME